MAGKGKYLLIVSMDVAPEKEALFNEVYDDEHIPYLSAIPGVVSVTRGEQVPLTMVIGGERQTIAIEGEPKYTAIYELEDAAIVQSDAWAEAAEKGRWATEVRPYTSNRRHVLRKIV